MSIRGKVVSGVFAGILAIWAMPEAWAGSATSVDGLYYTGNDASGGLAAGGAVDAHWSVTYARVGGTQYTGTSTYTGAAYVLSSDYIDAAYVANTSTAQWITAPGAKTAATGGTANVGGDYLPGNGTSGTNSAYYVYRLAFTIGGTGTGTVTNDIQISMTIAADDAYTVYVNPASSPTVSKTGTISAGGTAASASGTAAWNNTTSFALGNSTVHGGVNNSSFVIGTNYIYVVVANTNSQTGSSSSNALNPSGLLVYQVGSGVSIDGKPVPEVGSILPVALAIGLWGWRFWRRRRPPA
ncbi:MAG TPA: hypothetical protein VG936_07795 [Lacunisphaera sp.]|nr:hypothetical protein [Lacunisphaera sp.]